VRFTTADLDVIQPTNNLVVSGPFGTINNTNLDGGSSSAHGYLLSNSLPASSEAFLSVGGSPSFVVSFAYPLGRGSVFYSTIPLDCYLAGANCTNNPIALPLQTIYTPNVLIYTASATPAAVRPTLDAERYGNILLLIWPAAASGYVLESSTSLASPNWVRFPSAPMQIGDEYLTPVVMSAARNFYRLRLVGP
jgi:hypothetical protein